MAAPSTTYDTATLVNPTAALTDFPLLIDLSRLTAAWWSAVDTSAGTRGRAYKGDGTTELAVDWIDFDNVNETGWARVKWSGTLATTGTQQVRLYPPVSTNATVASTDTYGSEAVYESSIVAYFPMAQNANDRTSNSWSMTTSDTVAYGGNAAGAVTLDAGESLNLAYSSTIPSVEPFTIMGTVSQSATSAQCAMVLARNADSSYSAGNSSGYGSPSSSTHWAYSKTFVQRQAIGTSTVATGSSYDHVVAEISNSNARAIYVNGTSEGTDSNTANPTSLDNFSITCDVGSASLGDVIIINGTKSSGWYNQEADQATDQATYWGTWTNTPGPSTGPDTGVFLHHLRMQGAA